jgi:hypothetical protein
MVRVGGGLWILTPRTYFALTRIYVTTLTVVKREGKKMHKGTRAGKKRHKGSQEKAQGPAKKRHKGSQEKAQGQARKGARAGKKRHNGSL